MKGVFRGYMSSCCSADPVRRPNSRSQGGKPLTAGNRRRGRTFRYSKIRYLQRTAPTGVVSRISTAFVVVLSILSMLCTYESWTCSSNVRARTANSKDEEDENAMRKLKTRALSSGTVFPPIQGARASDLVVGDSTRLDLCPHCLELRDVELGHRFEGIRHWLEGNGELPGKEARRSSANRAMRRKTFRQRA